jgi:hypothetical protein
MFGIGEIKINANGKSKEEVKEEIMNEVKKKVDEMFEINEKIVNSHKKVEKKVEGPKPAKISLVLEEDKERTGFNVETNIEVDDLSYEELMTMITMGVANLFKQLFEEDAFQGMMAITQMLPVLMDEYFKDEEDEEDDGE